MKFDMVFEGGGAKGIAFLGALAELEARGHEPDRVVGTSAGAIFASLLAAGYTAQSMHALVSRRDEHGILLLARLLDPPGPLSEEALKTNSLALALERFDIPLLPGAFESRLEQSLVRQVLSVSKIRQLFSFLDLGGFFAGEYFVQWITGALNELEPGLGACTLETFHGRTGRDLSLVATDVDAQLMLVLNHRTAPEVPIVQAIKMSMCIPMIWQDVEWKAEWGRYLDRTLTGHTIADGGVVSNFPIHLIATQLAEVVEVMGDADPYRVPNLGFLIDESQGDPTFEAQEEEAGLLAGPGKRLARLVQTVLNARDQLVLEKCMKNHEVCRLPARGYGTTEFDMTPRRFAALVEAGRRATAAYLAERGV